MNGIEPLLSSLMQGLFRASWQASALAIVVLMIQWLAGGRLGARGRYTLWSIVLLRLLLPILPESRFSLYNLAEGWTRQSASARPVNRIEPQPQLQSEEPLIPIVVIGPHRMTQPAAEGTASPAPNPHIPSGQNTFIWIVGAIWLAGVGLMLAQIAYMCWKLSRILRQLPATSDDAIQICVDDCAAQLGLRRRPMVLVGDSIRTPAVVGVLHPKLLLPANVLEQCDSDQIRLIILHELAHLKRHDVSANWLIAVATVLHWFNPIVWLAAARMRADRELACDEMVLSSSAGRDAQAYGQTLVKLIEILSPRPMQPQLVGILESTAPMQRRVRMIAQFRPDRSRRWIWTSMILLILAGTSLTDAVRGQTKPSAQASRGTSTTRPATRPADTAVFDGSQDEVALQAQLAKRLAELNYTNAPFSEVVDQLRNITGANLVVAWRALEEAGIDHDSTVSLQMKNATLKQALEHLLKDVGGGGGGLGFTIDNGAILISTDEDLSRTTRTRAYDIRGLGSDADAIIKTVQSMVAPDSWSSKGGNSGEISELNGRLIIRHTPAVHEEIAQLMELLQREASDKPTSAVSTSANPFKGASADDASVSHSPKLPRTVVSDDQIEKANQAALALLQKKLPEVRFENQTLDAIMFFYCDVTSANVVVNWHKLEGLGIDRSSTCTLRLKDVTFERALSSTLQQLGAGSSLIMTVDRGVITITTADDVPAEMVTKIYDVSDLAKDTATESMQNLASLVGNLIQRQNVQSEDQIFGNSLVVTTTPMAQREVEKLLSELRKNPHAAANPTPDSAALEKLADELAMRDTTARKLLDLFQSQQAKVAKLKLQYGANHPEVTIAEHGLYMMQKSLIGYVLGVVNWDHHMTAEQMAQIDPLMRSLLAIREQKKADLERASAQLGANHPTVVNAKREFDRAAKDVEDYLEGRGAKTT